MQSGGLFFTLRINFSTTNITAHTSATVYNSNMLTDLQLILTLWIGLANLDSYHRILNACVVWMVFLLPAVTTPCKCANITDHPANTSKHGSRNTRKVCSITLHMF